MEACLSSKYGDYILSKTTFIGREGRFIALPKEVAKEGVSEEHVKIYWDNGNWWIEKRSHPSKKNLFIKKANSNICKEVKNNCSVSLEDGDKIILGTILFTFHEGAPQEITTSHVDTLNNSLLYKLAEYNYLGILLDPYNYSLTEILKRILNEANIKIIEDWEGIKSSINKDYLDSDGFYISDKELRAKIGKQLYIATPKKEYERFDEYAFHYWRILLSKVKEKYISKQLEEMIIGKSQQIKEIRKIIQRLALTSINILISGESGTGKELIAKALHLASNRSGKFCIQDLRRSNDDIVFSELYGTTKGAFVNAIDREGIIEEAHNGTLVLDGIEEASSKVISSLLRVIEEKRVRRIGGNIYRESNFRIICISQISLKELIKKIGDSFYYRISHYIIELPPLRERTEDIPLLAKYFWKKYNKEKVDFPNSIIDILQKYSWKGNVRELENFIKRLCIEKKINPTKVYKLLSSINVTFKKASKKTFIELLPDISKELKEYFDKQNYITQRDYYEIYNKLLEQRGYFPTTLNGIRHHFEKLVPWGWLIKKTLPKKNKTKIGYLKGENFGKYYLLKIKCQVCNKEDEIHNFEISNERLKNHKINILSELKKISLPCEHCSKKRLKDKSIKFPMKIQSIEIKNYLRS